MVSSLPYDMLLTNRYSSSNNTLWWDGCTRFSFILSAWTVRQESVINALNFAVTCWKIQVSCSLHCRHSFYILVAKLFLNPLVVLCICYDVISCASAAAAAAVAAAVAAGWRTSKCAADQNDRKRRDNHTIVIRTITNCRVVVGA